MQVGLFKLMLVDGPHSHECEDRRPMGDRLSLHLQSLAPIYGGKSDCGEYFEHINRRSGVSPLRSGKHSSGSEPGCLEADQFWCILDDDLPKVGARIRTQSVSPVIRVAEVTYLTY